MPSAAPSPQPSDDPPLPNIVSGFVGVQMIPHRDVTGQRFVHEDAVRRVALELADAVAKPLGRDGALPRARQRSGLARRPPLVVTGGQLRAP